MRAFAAVLLLGFVLLSSFPAEAQTTRLRVATCARTITAGLGAPFEIAGIKLRVLDNRAIDRHPANGFVVLEETLASRRKELIGLGRGYAKGTVFALANPEAAVRMVYEVFPPTRPTGKDEATAVRDDVKVLQARMQHWKLEPAGVKRWGESSVANYPDYADFLLKWGIIKQKVDGGELITNELIDEINRFDAAKVTTEARAYKPH